MEGEERGPGVTCALLERRVADLAGAWREDLSSRLGRPVELAPVEVSALPAASVAESDEPIVDQLCRILGDPPAFLHVVVPTPLALALSGLGRGQSNDELEATLRGVFDSGARDAFQQVARGLADGLQRVLAEHGLAEVEVQDAREVPEPASDPSWLDQDALLRARFRVELEGLPGGCVDLLFADLAGEASETASPASVCFLEAVDSERRAVAGLGAALGFSPLGVDPSELRGGLDERVLQSAAVVVPWKLGGRSGLELVESLAADPRLADVPIVVAAERPTREQLLAALRAGARSFASLPYDGAELRRRILAARGEADRI